MMNYYELIKKKKAGKEALVIEDASYTYGELVKMADSLAEKWSAENRKRHFYAVSVLFCMLCNW